MTSLINFIQKNNSVISKVEDKALFKKKNTESWNVNSQYWLDQNYIHLGLKECIIDEISQILPLS